MKSTKTERYHLVSNQINLLLITLITLVVADGVITNFLINEGLATEANPLLNRWVGQDYFPAIKLAGGFLAAVMLWFLWRRRPRLSRVVTISAVVLYTAVVLWNLFVLAVMII